MKDKTYFGIMHVYRFKGNRIDDEWFIHFSFESSYRGEEDCSQHDEDYWETFWKLPAVSYDKLCKERYASPSTWNYIRELEDVNTEGLHMGKWVKSSPFYQNGTWQQNRVDKV